MAGVPGLRRFFTTSTTSSGAKAPRNPEFWNNLKTEEKRKYYRCGDGFYTPKDLVPWNVYQLVKRLEIKSAVLRKKKRAVSDALNSKISLWQGDITRLEIDCIVNAANGSLLGGGGVDGAIHRAAGGSLRDECETLGGCSTGDAKITSGHKLPAKRVLHTVGPVGVNPQKLASCYQRCMDLTVKHQLRSVAFPCISTGVYGYPSEKAAHVALSTVRDFLDADDNAGKVDLVIFCVFLPKDVEVFHELLPVYFPTGGSAHTGGGAESTHTGGGAKSAHTGGGAESAQTGGGAKSAHTGGGAKSAHTGGGAESAPTGLSKEEEEELAAASLVEEAMEAEDRARDQPVLGGEVEEAEMSLPEVPTDDEHEDDDVSHKDGSAMDVEELGENLSSGVSATGGKTAGGIGLAEWAGEKKGASGEEISNASTVTPHTHSADVATADAATASSRSEEDQGEKVASPAEHDSESADQPDADIGDDLGVKATANFPEMVVKNAGDDEPSVGSEKTKAANETTEEDTAQQKITRSEEEASMAVDEDEDSSGDSVPPLKKAFTAPA